jgi:hypothetical protein
MARNERNLGSIEAIKGNLTILATDGNLGAFVDSTLRRHDRRFRHRDVHPAIELPTGGGLVAGDRIGLATALGEDTVTGHAALREEPGLHGLGAITGELEIHIAAAPRIRIPCHHNLARRIRGENRGHIH